MIQHQQSFEIVKHHPHWAQFFISESIPISLYIAVFIVAGMGDVPCRGLFVLMDMMLGLFVTYKFLYFHRLNYYVSGEQFIIRHGVFTSNSNYIELYRIVDYDERRNFIQQIVGLKTVTIYSGDRTTPQIDVVGVPERYDLVAVIRERVEFNKQRKGVYEITNR